MGIEIQEDFFRRAIEVARQRDLPDIASQAEAWLAFSIDTRLFEHEVEVAATLRRMRDDGVLPQLPESR